MKKRVENFLRRQGLKVILYRSILTILPNRIAKNITFRLNVGGGSYTDGREIVVGVPEYFWGMSNEEIFSAAKALSGHETEHVLSSDFDLFVGFQQQIANDFNAYLETGVLPNASGDFKKSEKFSEEVRQYNAKKRYGMKLGQHLLNSTEDGRIEKRHGNRRRGYVKHLKFLNAVVWENQPVTGDNELQEFLFSITSMCVTGMKSKDWDDVYGGTEQDRLLDEIRPLIIKAINEPTAKGCADRTYEIFQIIAPQIAKMVEDDLDAMDLLSELFDFKGASAPEDGELGDEDGEDGGGGLSVSVHFKPEEDDESTDEDNQESGNSSGKSDDESKEESDEDSGGGSGDNSESDESNMDEEDEEGSGSSDESPKEGQGGSGKQEGDSSTNKPEVNAETKKKKDSYSRTGGGGANRGTPNTSEEDQSLVDDFMNNEKDEILEEAEDDLGHAEEEDRRIEAEERRRKRESGDLNQKEIEEILRDTHATKFTQTEIDLTATTPTPSEIQNKGKKLRKNLEKILLNQATPTRKHQKRGYLDRNNLYKVGMNDYEVFERRGNPNKSSFAVSVLVDRSGSMRASAKRNKTKMDCAMEACAVIEEGLKGLVPLRINLFNDFGGHYDEFVLHTNICDFGDTNQKVNHSYNSREEALLGNADGMSVRVATKELQKRKETKKLLIVLSDGLPARSYTDGVYDPNKDLQNAVREARKKGVQVIAICFGSEKHLEDTRVSYRQMYQKGIIMTTPENIPEHLIKVMEREIQ